MAKHLDDRKMKIYVPIDVKVEKSNTLANHVETVMDIVDLKMQGKTRNECKKLICSAQNCSPDLVDQLVFAVFGDA